MNSFKTTKIFTLLDKVFDLSPKIGSIDKWIKNYSIDKDKYDYLVQICKTYKYTLAKKTVNCLEKGEIIPYNSQNPKDEKYPMIDIPTSLTSLTFRDDKKIVTAVDTCIRASYTRNKLNKEIEAYSINEKDFYFFSQRGFVARSLIINNDAYSTNAAFIRAVMNSYTRLMAKPISAVYGTGAKAEWMMKLQFITAVFCLQNFFNYDLERAKTFALSLAGINKIYISRECKFFNLNNANLLDMRSSIDPRERARLMLKDGNSGESLYPVDAYVEALKLEFEEMRTGKIEYRSIMDRFVSMYGQNALTCIEHCESFINMIISSELKCGIYNEKGIFDLAKDDVKVLSSILAV